MEEAEEPFELSLMITKSFTLSPSRIRHTLLGTLHSLQQRKWSSFIFKMNSWASLVAQ